MHVGLDCSSNNTHPIDYVQAVTALAAMGNGATPFVIVKVSQGSTYVNPYVQQDVAGFRSAGAVVAGYLMDEGSADPAAEEALYRRTVGNLPQTDDDELPDGVADYAAHCQLLVAQNNRALDYLNQSEVAGGLPSGAGLWLAEYNDQPGVVSYPCVIHQFTSTGSLAGISGHVDLNAWLGTEALFTSFFAINGAAPGGPIVSDNGNPATDPEIPDAVDVAMRPGYPGQTWVLGPDGGVFARPIGGPTPFYGSYPGLPAQDRQGSRSFLRIVSHADGEGYTLLANDGSYYSFGSPGPQ